MLALGFKQLLSSLPGSSSAIIRHNISTLTAKPALGFLASRLVPAMGGVQVRQASKGESDSRGEANKDGQGIELYSKVDGRRTTLMPVVMRFKRLDWGAWIRPRAGRNKKWWKKSHQQLIRNEKHVFCHPSHKKLFDRAVSMEYKAKRSIPDDPYKVYNDLSFQRYHSIKLKNMERIKKYGSKINNFPAFVAHPNKNIKPEDIETNLFYEPPGYHSDIADEIYCPDTDRPQNIPAPHFELQRRQHSKYARKNEKNYWRQIRRAEPYYGRIGLCSKLRLPVVGTKLG